MNNSIIAIIKSILAGMCIVIGCNAYLSCDNKYIGAFLFAIGLITILLFDLNLFTGKVCYIPNNDTKFIKEVVLTLVGNIIGCLIFGAMLTSDNAMTICQNKLLIAPIDLLFKSIMCNILIYIAVDTYKTNKTLIATIFCIPVFILSGYEHSIANIAYFTIGRMWSWQSVIFVAITIIGNAIGGVLIPICKIIINKLTIQND